MRRQIKSDGTDRHPKSRHRTRGWVLSVAALAWLLSPVAVAVDWDLERVDDGFNWIGSSVSIVVGSDGTPHIANGAHRSQIIRYAVKDAGTWDVQEADVYPSGLSASITLDLDENPCMAYDRSGSLIFSRLSGGSWARETVGPMQSDNKTAVCIAYDGTPHVAYGTQGSPWSVRHAYKPAGTWLISEVDSTIASGNGIGMVLDDLGDPHLVHWGAPYGGAGPFQTRYSTWDAGVWQNDVVEGTGENCNVFHSGIALDAFGTKHLAFMSHDCWGSSELMYARGDIGAWDVEIVDSFGSSAGSSLVLDDTGSPHIVYGTGYSMVGGTSQLRYAYLDAAGDWVVEVVDDLNDAGEINALAIDSEGYLHIAYFRGTGYDQWGDVLYARSTTPVGGGGCAGDIDGDGDTDLGDLAALLAAYDTCEGHPSYNPAADLDEDGCVGLADLAFLLADYGCGS